MSSETIKVCCRFRKEFAHSEEEYDSWQFDTETSTISLNSKNWTYDYILTPDSTQEIMYNKVAYKTISDFTEGYHGTIFAYGQSGSGKTYSMLGPDIVLETLTTNNDNELYGITPRAVYQIFDSLNEFSRNGTNWKLTLSYIEIYNEKVKCLLSGKNELKIREDPNEGFIIPEKESIDCKNPKEIFEGIHLANKNRATGATNQNERSSRSHSIMQLELIYNSIDGLVRKSRLSLVDLAGSERIAKTGAEGQRLKEAQKINQSLTTLGMVIMALTTPGSKHVPFRNSKLTLILRDSLGGSSKTTLLCTASRLKRHSEESIQTLYFASRAKSIKNLAKKNVILNAGELQYICNGLKKELMFLRGQIKKVGFQWILIENKKLLSFIDNEEFLFDESENIEKINSHEEKKNNDNKKEKNNNNNKETFENGSNLINIDKKNKKDIELEELMINLETEKVLLNKIIEELNEKLDNKDLEDLELKAKIENYIQQIGQFENIIEEKKEIETNINELNKKIIDKKNYLNNLLNEEEIKKIENKNLIKEINNEKENNFFNKINNIKEEIKINDKKIKKLESQLNELENNYNNIKKENENISNNNDLNEDKKNMNNSNNEIENNLNSNNKNEFNENINNLRNINKNLLDENKNIKNEILNIKISLEKEKNSISNKYKNKLNDIQNKLDLRDFEIKNLTNKKNFLNSYLQSQNKKNELLNQIIKNQKQEIENKITNKNSKEEEIYLKENSELKNTLKIKNSELENLKKENLNLKKKIEDFSKQNSNFKPFQSTIETHSFDITDLHKKNSISNSTTNLNMSKNIFGVILKKISDSSNPNYLEMAKTEAKDASKRTEDLFKNQIDLLSNLRQNIENSPKTVSSYSIEDEIPELDFANEDNIEIVKKIEDLCIEQELQHKTQKELRETLH